MIDAKNLTNVQLFSGLTLEEINIVIPYLSEVKMEKGEYIIRENDEENSLYILYKGNVRITKKLTLDLESSEAEEKMLATLDDHLHPVFGEIGIIGTSKRTASVIALTDCILYQLTDKKFEQIVEKNIRIGYIIMKNLAITIAKRLEKTDENVVKLATALSIAVFKK